MVEAYAFLYLCRFPALPFEVATDADEYSCEWGEGVIREEHRCFSDFQ